MVKVLLVDDHELVATGLKMVLETSPDIESVDVVDSGESALRAVEKNRPNVILMDIELPGMNGAEASKRILEKHPEIKIICLSQYNKKKLTRQLLKLGVSGFVSKSSPPEEMMRAIRKVMEGEIYLSADVAQNIVLPPSEKNNSDDPFSALSSREAETIELILKGKSTREIAEIMGVETKTVNTFRYRAYKKLGVKSELELFRLKERMDEENFKLKKKKKDDGKDDDGTAEA